MWPAPSHSSSVEPSIIEWSLRLCSIGVSLSRVPQMIAVGTLLIACTVSNFSRVPNVGKKSATTPNGVAESISSTNSTYRAGTASPNASSSVATSATECPSLRNRSTVRWPRASAATSRDANCPPTVEGSSGSTMRWGSTPPAVVPIRPTPTMRSPNSSGCSSASATMVMPPIEWPTSTTGPSGTATSSTRSRSWPSCSMLACSSLDRPDRPWERWS